MQWKLPFSQYFESDLSRLNRMSSQYTQPLDDTLITTRDQPSSWKNTLSEDQNIVINKFPSPFDKMDQNWEKMDKLIDEWKDKKEIWPLSYGIRIVTAVNTMSSFYVLHLFRKAFKLADGRTALLNIYVPGLMLPMFFGSIFHYRYITAPIAAGMEDCRLCRGLRAGLIQSISSTVYPFIYGSISSIYFADYFMTYATPDSIKDKTSRQYLYDIWLKAVRRNKIPLISASILNFLFAYYMTTKEEQTLEFMYFSLLRQQSLKTQTIYTK